MLPAEWFRILNPKMPSPSPLVVSVVVVIVVILVTSYRRQPSSERTLILHHNLCTTNSLQYVSHSHLPQGKRSQF